MTIEEAKKLWRNKEYNKELIRKYPFLLPRDINDEVPEDYDYSYTELDQMPDGWRYAFGEEMCREIQEEIFKSNLIEYRILQIKEKYGSLCWYDNGRITEIIRNYI